MMYLGQVVLFILPVLCAAAFNYTSCDQAKQPKFMSSCCDVQRNDQAIKTCRKSLLSRNATTTNNGESRNLKSDKVALHACIAECAFKANGFLLTNGTVNVAAVQRSYQQRYKNDANMSQLMVSSLNSCVDYAKKRTQQYQWMHTKGECDYYPATLLACTLEQVYVKCPATKWKNTDECAAMRKYLIACDDVKGSNGRK